MRALHANENRRGRGRGVRTESAERAHTRTATYTGRSVELVESLEVARNANDLKRRCAHTRRGTTSQAPDSRRMHMRAASHGTSPDGARAGCLELSVQREGVGAPTNYTTGRVCSARTSAGGPRPLLGWRMYLLPPGMCGTAGNTVGDGGWEHT